jgi:hypothetical protein
LLLIDSCKEYKDFQNYQTKKQFPYTGANMHGTTPVASSSNSGKKPADSITTKKDNIFSIISGAEFGEYDLLT